MTKFRPCIDLHDGKVKQIVGGTLTDSSPPKENFVADRSAAWFAELYKKDGLTGGHLIKLGPGNDSAALSAIAAYPGGLQVGGGINDTNATDWLEAGASHVIVTSWLFENAKFQINRLEKLVSEIGAEKLVIDLSCRRTSSGWTVAMDRWQTLTNLEIKLETLEMLSGCCSEFLVHAADVEGLCGGIDQELIESMKSWGDIPITYAGGVANFSDVELVESASQNRIDVTVGSSLDLFGGTGVKYAELVAWNNRAAKN